METRSVSLLRLIIAELLYWTANAYDETREKYHVFVLIISSRPVVDELSSSVDLIYNTFITTHSRFDATRSNLPPLLRIRTMNLTSNALEKCTIYVRAVLAHTIT